MHASRPITAVPSEASRLRLPCPLLPHTTEMICPHCNQTIREEERYLMSRDPHAEFPSWGKYGLYVLLFLILVGVFSLHAHA
jgi:hypothetical protein